MPSRSSAIEKSSSYYEIDHTADITILDRVDEMLSSVIDDFSKNLQEIEEEINKLGETGDQSADAARNELDYLLPLVFDVADRKAHSLHQIINDTRDKWSRGQGQVTPRARGIKKRKSKKTKGKSKKTKSRKR